MSKKITFLIFFFIILTSLFQGTKSEALASYIPETIPDEQISSKKLDKKAEILSAYLAKFDSPMQYSAQDFIDAAKEYDLDWKMLPAIAGVESTFGKFIPGGYNAYGWGVYGTQAIYFTSWREGIFTVAKGLRENYLNKGLTDPYSINRIYAASPRWGDNVTHFMNDLEKFTSEYSVVTETAQVGFAPNIAAISGQLTSN